MCFAPQRRAIFGHRNFKKGSDTVSFLAFSLPNVLFATAACNFWTSELQKGFRHRQFFSIFTSKCAFRHSGVQFLDIGNFKKGSDAVSFLAFSLPNVLFAAQRRAIFGHRNFKKGSDTVSFLAFSLPNVLFATAACNFWTSELQKGLRHRQFFSIFTSKCAFRHSGVQFWNIGTSKMAPRLYRCFVHFDLTNVLRPRAPCHFSPVC